MIGIIDYGMGNLRSVQKAFEKIGASAIITNDANKIASSKAIVFPGQGSFPDAMKSLQQLDLIEPIIDAIRSGKPFLGICLGIQLLFTSSEEGGNVQGLGILQGEVKKFPPGKKIPHIGWNSIQKTDTGKNCSILDGIQDNSYFYFVHSYYVDPVETDSIAATTEYTTRFPSIIWKDNLFATQFHPEKSHRFGLKLLHNFINTIR